MVESTDWLNGVVSKLDLSKPFPLCRIGVPSVRREGGFLYFRPEGPFRDAPKSARLLYEFAGLTDATVLRFAERWGPLGLCEQHRLPVLHKRTGVCLPRVCGDELAESIAPWRRLVAVVKAILSIRTALARGSAGNPRDWRTLWRGELETPNNVYSAYGGLALALNALLDRVNVRPFISFDETRLAIWFGTSELIHVFQIRGNPRYRRYRDWFTDSGMLLATISIQLALAACAGAGLSACDACGSLYQPAKGPRAGERHYCPKCGKPAAYRIAKRIERGDSEAEALAKERR